MKQIVQEILEGNFRADNTSLNFSCPRIDLTLSPDYIQEGSFTIFGPEGYVTEGKVISSDLRMECLTPTFAGIQDEIYYRIDTTDMKISDTIKGAFYIESNQGEYYLPFSVTIIPETIDSSLGEVKNLFHFINLAKTNWSEAVSFFYSDDFVKLLTGNDAQYYTTYRGLSAIYGNEHNVEEFLLETGKKKAIEYIPEKTYIKMENPEEDTRYALTINRNGWGCTCLNIETEGDFIYVEEEVVLDDDFLGNTYHLYYYIQSDRLHAGNNYGSIRLRSFERVITIPITIVITSPDAKKYHKQYLEKKQITCKLMKYYQAYRLKKIGTKTWMDETGKLIERLKAIDGNDPATDLFQAQLLMAKERFHEARWLLEQNRDKIEMIGEEKPELRCYYLYLSTLYSENEAYIDEATDEIVSLYEMNRGNWRIAWLLLFLSDERVRTPARKWALLEELFSYKCTSPMLYMEAWNLLCMNPATLLRLEDFELQVLTYAVKNDAMKEDVIIQLLYLAQKTKGFSQQLLQILIMCYEKRKESDILHAICTLLIKGDKYGKKYLKWYREGVEQNLRITRLYEYYMMSVPLDGKETIPKVVLMYFAYQSDLSYEITAYLYAYVHKRQEEFPELYVNYVSEIEKFVLKQIKAGRINNNLAYLYRNVITQPMVDAEVAKNLMDMLFLQDIIIEDDKAGCAYMGSRIRNIIVEYPYADKELTYLVNTKKTQVPVFDKECKIILEDSDNNRYTNSISFHMDKLFISDKLAGFAAPFSTDHLGYAIYTCYGHKDMTVVNEGNLQQYKYLAGSDFLKEDERLKIRSRLIRFYYENDRMWELDEYLLSLSPTDIAPDDRKEVIRIMVLRGMYKEAYEWVRCGAPYDLDAKTLAKLFSRLLVQEDILEDEFVTGLLHYVVKRGKYDEYILKYLVHNFNGNIKDMRDIWKICAQFGVDAYELSERMIIQMLYTGAYIGEGTDIFKSYMKSGGSDEVISAFLAQSSYDYVIKEKITDSSLAEAITRIHREGVELQLVCKLAYLKYYAENKSEISEEIKEVIREFLQEMLEHQIILPIFKEYQNYLPALDIIQDKSILEYRAAPGNRVAIHYMILNDDAQGAGYNKENMREVFAGICIKEFVLFFGERLQYYITEDVDGEEKVTLSGTIRKSDLSGDKDDTTSKESSRFNMLNDIMIGKTLHDYDTVDQLLEEYYKKSFIVENLFRLQ
ncbi:MAG: hypothetical protein HDR03_00710 [Lachnospiraceae bacterium]|nr:hypothetical protein [Lachnospiraceae bacterium]